MNAAGGDWFVIQQKCDPLVTSECRSGRQYNFCSDSVACSFGLFSLFGVSGVIARSYEDVK